MSLPKRNGYAAPLLSFERVAEHLEGIVEIAGNLLEPDAQAIVSQACDELRAIKSETGGGPRHWSIPESRPIRTVPDGKYQPDGKGGLMAQAHVSFIWEIEKRSVDKHSKEKDHFAIVGLCSTKATITEASGRLCGLDAPTGWTFEMGADDSPGCHFHTQINWKSPLKQLLTENDMQGWPSLDVPRLPSIFLTPGDCLDFVLGEMFQESWPARYEEAGLAKIGRWVGEAQTRMTAMLQASLDAVSQGGGSSPWMSIKQWYPTNSKMLIS